jgi:hypothetical protein
LPTDAGQGLEIIPRQTGIGGLSPGAYSTGDDNTKDGDI